MKSRLRWDLERGECGNRGLPRPGVGVASEGEGKAASMSDIDPDREGCLDFSFSFSSISSMPIRLAVFPRSRLDASRVALRISSGRLVALPLGSDSLTASSFNRGGRFPPLSLIEPAVEALGVVPAVDRAPPFSSPAIILATRGSTGDVGEAAPESEYPSSSSLSPNVAAGEVLFEDGARNVGNPAPGPNCTPWPALEFSSEPPLESLRDFRAGFPGLPMLTFLTRLVDSS